MKDALHKMVHALMLETTNRLLRISELELEVEALRKRLAEKEKDVPPEATP